jgi:hypothetical protein
MDVMQNMFKVILMCVVSFGATSAFASTINGSMAVMGSMDTNGMALENVTDIAITNLFGAGSNGVGDLFNVDMFDTGAGGAVSLTAFAPVAGFITVENWSFDLQSLNVIDQTSGLLTLKGSGLLHDTFGVLTSTAANWELTAVSNTSYGITVTTVPVPAAMWLFGSGLLGLVGYAQRKV